MEKKHLQICLTHTHSYTETTAWVYLHHQGKNNVMLELLLEVLKKHVGRMQPSVYQGAEAVPPEAVSDGGQTREHYLGPHLK